MGKAEKQAKNKARRKKLQEEKEVEIKEKFESLKDDRVYRITIDGFQYMNGTWQTGKFWKAYYKAYSNNN